MIPLFPYWTFVIHSSLSHEEALKRLSSAVAPFRLRPSLFSWDRGPQPFMGSVSADEFNIERIIQYRNSFLPTIHGHFLPTETGLQIRVVMVLNPIAMLLGIGSGLCVIPILASIVYRFTTVGYFDNTTKALSLLTAFFYMMFTAGFGFEAVRARRLLNHIFEASS